jgi:hypothetical protein
MTFTWYYIICRIKFTPAHFRHINRNPSMRSIRALFFFPLAEEFLDNHLHNEQQTPSKQAIIKWVKSWQTPFRSFKTSLNGVFIVVAPELNSNSVNIFRITWQLIHKAIHWEPSKFVQKFYFFIPKNKGTWKLKL